MDGVRVVRSRDRIAVLGALRLALGVGAGAIALTRVPQEQAALGLVLGALGLAVVGTARQLELGRATVTGGLPEHAVIERPLRAALGGLLPSSAGLFALALIAVPLEAALTPVLAGMLVGMALVTFASVAQITSDERLRRRRIYTTVEPPPRAFAVEEPGTEPSR